MLSPHLCPERSSGEGCSHCHAQEEVRWLFHHGSVGTEPSVPPHQPALCGCTSRSQRAFAEVLWTPWLTPFRMPRKMCLGLEHSTDTELLGGTSPGQGLNRYFLMFKINGSVQMESALLYTFLEVSSDCQFREQLQSLQSQGLVSSLKGTCCYEDELELQTDGNRSGHLQNGELGERSSPSSSLQGVGFLPLFPSWLLICFRAVMFFPLRDFTT